MALRIYIRQHAPKCLSRIQERIEKGEIQPLSADELMDYRHCKCAWWMYGTSDGGVVYKPKSLKVYSYAAAEAKRKAANKSPEDLEAESDISVHALTDEFLKERKATGITEETEATYKRVGYRMVEFCKKQKVFKAKKVGADHITRLRQTWIGEDEGELGNIKDTVNFHVGIVRMIFAFGYKQGYIDRNPTDSLKPIVKTRLRGADADDAEEGENGRTLPLDEEGDSNYRKVMAGVTPFLTGKLVVPGRKYARAKAVPFLTDTDRFILLLEVMYETGLRISDAIHFKPNKIIVDDEVASYTTKQIKTGDPVTVFFPLQLAERIKALKPLYKDYVFFDNSIKWRRFISDVIWRTLVDLGNAIGVPELRPHRFRDSFAVNRLNENMAVEHVQILLGHRRLATTLKYYNPWVKSRHDNLRANYLAARKTGEFAKRGRVVKIDKRRA